MKTTSNHARPDWLMIEPEAGYHAKTHRGEFLSSGLLKEALRGGRFAYQAKLTAYGAGETFDSRAFRIGRLVHAATLEGYEAYERELVRQGYAGTTMTDQQLARMSAELVHADRLAGSLLADGWAEGVVETTLHGLPCHARIDWFNPYAGIVDLKTTRSLDTFEADMIRYGYLHQLAFYRALVEVVIGIAVPCKIIAIEKSVYPRVKVYNIDPARIDAAAAENTRAIKELVA
ncbi:MAG: hypothetical protein HN909_05435 [Phycisphaerales bacterium]|jgi:hypothetical protein|nr:hypothetical protein [Phycisphaerales bacterium]MBT7171196.1 hypothetical protein [Phycisphaerales bacterium]